MEIAEYAFLKKMLGQRETFEKLKKYLYEDPSDENIIFVCQQEKLIIGKIFTEIEKDYSVTKEEVDKCLLNSTESLKDFYVEYIKRKKAINNKLNSEEWKKIKREYVSNPKKIIKDILSHKNAVLLDKLSQYNFLNTKLIEDLIKNNILTDKNYGKDVAPLLLYRSINRGQVEESRLLFNAIKHPDKELLTEALYCIGRVFCEKTKKAQHFLESLSPADIELIQKESEHLLLKDEKIVQAGIWGFFQKHKLQFEKMNVLVSPFEKPELINVIKYLSIDLQKRKLFEAVELTQITHSPAKRQQRL